MPKGLLRSPLPFPPLPRIVNIEASFFFLLFLFLFLFSTNVFWYATQRSGGFTIIIVIITIISIIVPLFFCVVVPLRSCFQTSCLKK